MTKQLINSHLQVQMSEAMTDSQDAFTIEYNTKHPTKSGCVSLKPIKHASLAERWTGSFTRVTDNSSNRILHHSEQFLLGAVPTEVSGTIALDTENAYKEIFKLITHLGYPHLLRTWNFFPAITEQQNQTDNYQQFCKGRTLAYKGASLPKACYPAATVIGTQQAGLFIYFIASKQAGIGIENKEQVSAYEYPSQYSVDPPLFSRALLHQSPQQDCLFISGTASIAGHATQHIGQVEQQLALCIHNVENLLSTAYEQHGFKGKRFTDCEQIKIYVKNRSDIDVIENYLHSHFDKTLPAFYFIGDMCREDLLVEIEAFISHSHA